MLRFLRFAMRTGLPWAALVLHFVVVCCFARRWDKAMAITVVPFWVWGFAGLMLAALSWIFFRTRFSRWIVLLWLATIVIGSDETKPLMRFAAEKPLEGLPKDFEGKKTLRVISLNCKNWNQAAAQEIAAWKPDIALLQEAHPGSVRALAESLFPDGKPHDHYAASIDCAVLTRGKILAYGSAHKYLPCKILIDGREIGVVCVHLQGAETKLSLYRRSTWLAHYHNRQSRRAEMIALGGWLNMQMLTNAPALVGGDFNAPAGDAIFRELEGFKDAFAESGSGWGNTYPNHTPLVRIDHIYANARLKPVRARTVKTVNSDHRMVVADFLTN